MKLMIREIPNYGGDYVIFSSGSVYSNKSGSYLKQGSNVKGYRHVVLCKDGQETNIRVHKLVAEAFLQKPAIEGLQINHKNGKKDDNSYENLEWVTASENMKHAYRTGLFAPPRAMAVDQFIVDGDTIRYGSIKEASRQTGVDASSISAVCKGQRKHAGGFNWEYCKIVEKETEG